MVHQAQGLLVQEVAADGELPSRYVLKEQQGRPAAAADAQRAAPSIPTVDVDRLADADAGEADKLRSALASWGLFAVTGHGMTDPFLDAILGAARGFFHLPTEAKQEYSNVVDADDGGRKFQPEGYGVDRVDTDEQVLDWCDRLYLQVRPDDARQLRFWPTHPSDLAELLKEFSVEGEKVAKLVVTAMARCLGFEEGFFLDKVGERMPSYARFTYYPPCPRPDLVHGLKPHTDNSVVTVLLLDEQVCGLQVLKDGSWVDVPVLGDGSGWTRSGAVLSRSKPAFGPAAGGPVRTGPSRLAVLFSGTAPARQKPGPDRRAGQQLTGGEVVTMASAIEGCRL
uniref:Predicted protein n=1 Tax=Hordeum vulgare subsp. vulgare TaxID=112509 RepID=F2CSY8_HORVV|nr:predicted protein [Hordeum vulgare subsp. vulgare]